MTSFAFDPNFGDDTIVQLKTLDGTLEQALGDLQTAISNFLGANQGASIDNYAPAQAKFNQGHIDHQAYLQNGYSRLQAITDNYHYHDAKGAAGFQGAHT
jgi:uncharacterized protein YukE